MILNCDMGEGTGNDAAIMPYIQAANIACGYHAGDVTTMRQTILLAKKHGVAAGAHPSFADRENFGRTEMQYAPEAVYEMVRQQLQQLHGIAAAEGIRLAHVKPHGALYNMAAKDPPLARSIAAAIRDFDNQLVVFGLSGSAMITEAQAAGLSTCQEVFADRTYQDNGSLTPRSQPGALITEERKAVQQVLQMLHEKTVTTVSGKRIPVIADTVCIHGDGKHAVAFAKAIRRALDAENPGKTNFKP